MSRDGMKWALRFADIPNPTPPGMPSTHTLRLVLIYLGDYANDNHDESSWASVGTLAKLTGLSDRQVQKCLAALSELGLIAPGDPRIAAERIERGDRRPNVWRLIGVNVGHPEKSNGVKSGPNGVNVVRKRGERGSPNLLEEHLQEQERRDEAHPKPKRAPRARRRPLSEDWQPKIEECVAASRFDEAGVRRHATRFRQWLKATGKTFADYDARFLQWLDDEREVVVPLHDQGALFPRANAYGETAEQKAARIAAEVEARNKRVAEQFARRDENERWHAARAQEPQVSAQESQADQEPDHDVNDPAAVRAHLIAAGYDFGEGATG